MEHFFYVISDNASVVDVQVNLADVPGSGKDGRVLKEDIIAYVERGGRVKATPPTPLATPPPLQQQSPPQTPASTGNMLYPICFYNMSFY